MKKFHIILIVLFGFLDAKYNFACGNSNSGSCTMEMSSKRKKIVVKDSHSKSNKHNDCNGKCGRPMQCSICKYSSQLLILNLKLIVLILIFHLKKNFINPVSFTSAGYTDLWLILK
jgi:hypothetical protein